MKWFVYRSKATASFLCGIQRRARRRQRRQLVGAPAKHRSVQGGEAVNVAQLPGSAALQQAVRPGAVTREQGLEQGVRAGSRLGGGCGCHRRGCNEDRYSGPGCRI